MKHQTRKKFYALLALAGVGYIVYATQFAQASRCDDMRLNQYISAMEYKAGASLSDKNRAAIRKLGAGMFCH